VLGAISKRRPYRQSAAEGTAAKIGRQSRGAIWDYPFLWRALLRQRRDRRKSTSPATRTATAEHRHPRENIFPNSSSVFDLPPPSFSWGESLCSSRIQRDHQKRVIAAPPRFATPSTASRRPREPLFCLGALMPYTAGQRPVSGSGANSVFLKEKTGGEGGIRTLGTLAGTPDFESGTIDHSATSPRCEGETVGGLN
jgi:hypothetical protein